MTAHISHNPFLNSAAATSHSSPSSHVEKTRDHNLGKEVCNVYDRYFDLMEKRLHAHTDELEVVNQKMRHVATLMNALTHEQMEYKKANFSSNGEVRAAIDAIHEYNPTLFQKENRYIFKDEESIKAALQALDAEMKMHPADANRLMMKITHLYDMRAQMTRHAQEVLKEGIDFIKSIIHKQRVNG